MQKIILKVDGMTCSACSNHVEKYLNKQPGVLNASVNLVMGQALIYYEDNINIETLGKYINASGYKYAGVYDPLMENKKDYNKIYLILLGLLMVFIMYLTMAHMIKLPCIPYLDKTKFPVNYTLALLILTIPYLIYGRDIIKMGIKNLFIKAPNMDTLVSLGILTNFIYSLVNTILIISGKTSFISHIYYESVCMIVLFIKLGRFIDSKSKEKTKEAIQELVKVTPENALIKTKDGEQEITIDEVKVGDTLILKPGMKVAVDGEVLTGEGHFDESFITGESNPVKKVKGSAVVAGSINYDGYLEYKALKIGPKSTISEMIHLVMEATNSKMPISKVADKVSSYFVPIIIILAILTFIVYLILGSTLNDALTHLVTVLVVACPCAIGLATPLAIVTSIGTATKKGLLIKSSDTLEIASHITTIVFDKTGTLTYGELKINKIYNYSPYPKKELLNIISNIEENSTHPIAMAFKNYKTSQLKITNYQELPGLGLKAKIKNKTYLIGNAKILKDILNNYLKDEQALASLGHSLVYVVENNQIIALIGVKDVVKKDSRMVIRKLEEQGYKVVMLTGDNELTANIIGKEVGIKNIVANVMPSAKTNYIKELKENKEKVIMVGDGINDAPSLTTAEIGISFKNSTDIATNSANIIITNNELSQILTFLTIGKKTLRNIKQNLFWAFFYNILMIPLAMGLFKNVGLELNPMIASGAMMLSSLCVIFNALRLRKIK